MRRLLLALALAGCGDDTIGGNEDAAQPAQDLAGADLAGADLAGADQAMPPSGDMATQPSPDMAGLGCGNWDGGVFPSFDRGCGNSMNCSLGFHQVDCCGSFVATGFNHAFRDEFDAAEVAWEAGCAVCNCAPMPFQCDDGKTTPNKMGVTVTCDNNVCTTHCQ